MGETIDGDTTISNPILGQNVLARFIWLYRAPIVLIINNYEFFYA